MDEYITRIAFSKGATRGGAERWGARMQRTHQPDPEENPAGRGGRLGEAGVRVCVGTGWGRLFTGRHRGSGAAGAPPGRYPPGRAAGEPPRKTCPRVSGGTSPAPWEWTTCGRGPGSTGGKQGPQEPRRVAAHSGTPFETRMRAPGAVRAPGVGGSRPAGREAQLGSPAASRGARALFC